MTNLATAHQRVDAIHQFCATLPPADLPVTHRFTPGMYAREIFMPKGSLVVSKIHKTEHPFVVITGHAAVWDAENGVQQLRGGQVGITKPGTRRVLFIHEDCRWITFHATDKLDVDEIEAEIIEPYSVSELAGNRVEADVLKLLTGEPKP
jgi:hypothetical protein